MQISKFIIILAVAVPLFVFNSCKRGCTNPLAINYDKSAKEEDASCLYCDSVYITESNSINSYNDQNPSSQYYGDYVLQVPIRTFFYSYEGNACKKRTDLGTCNATLFLNSDVEVTFVNLTDKTMDVSARIRYFSPSTGALVLDTNLSVSNISPQGSVQNVLHITNRCLQAFSAGDMYITDKEFTYQ